MIFSKGLQMIHFYNKSPPRGAVLTALVLCMLGQAGAQTTPDQKPLLSSSSGARSNVMLILDNSGSMAFPFPDTYNIQSASQANTKISAAGATPEIYTNSWLAMRSADVNSMYYNPRITYSPRVDRNGVALVPDSTGITAPPDVRFVANSTSNVTYYSIVSNSDDAYTATAADVRNAFYAEHNVSSCGSGSRYCIDGATNPNMSPWQHPRHQRWTMVGTTVQNDAKTSITAANPAPTFTYVICGKLTESETGSPSVVRDAAGQETNCSFTTAQATVSGTGVPSGTHVRVISWNSGATISLPYDHKRTDCGTASNNTCTNASEITNIVNWYKYYGTRATATATAIGQALAASRQGGLRIGYSNINRLSNVNTEQLGTVNNNKSRLRGVRVLDSTSTSATTLSNTQEVFDWLYRYGSTPRGATPLHRPLINAGEYYRIASGQTENPWAVDPSTTQNTVTNPELSCRRSFSVMFSDGAWTASQAVLPTQLGTITDAVNASGVEIKETVGATTKRTFTYSPSGPSPSNVVTRKDYVPYPTGSGRSNGLADVAAYYNWRTDLRGDSSDNNISTKPGRPQFWQNMSTYTVGYQVRPSGENGGAGLSFAQISNYRQQYFANGTGTGTTLPNWPTQNLTTASETTRIDDFIHAGYAGGARSFSVSSAEEVKRAFDTIFAETSDGTGNDAGVAIALSSSGGTNSTSNSAKYTTEYATGSNSGDVLAYKLDTAGDVVDTNTTDSIDYTPLWSAKDRLNAKIISTGNTNWRRLFTRNSTKAISLHDGSATVVAPDSDVMTALDPTGYFPTDGAQMVRYLLGDDSRVNRQGVPLRQRESMVGASVNSPPLLVFNNQDMAYYYPAIKTVTDATTNVETQVVNADVDIEGRATYKAYLTKKGSYPPVVMSANNNGTVQVFNAAKVTTESTGETDLTPLGGGSKIKAGEELAAFMPLGIGSKLRKLSDETFTFEYILDGRMSEEDIYQAGADSTTSAWRQIVVGTSGRADMGTIDFKTPTATAGAGRFIYALNSPFLEENGDKKRIPSAEDFLWEKSWPDLGFISNVTTAGQLSAYAGASGKNKWVVLSNSGHYANKHGLYVLNALTGAQIGFVPTTDSGDGLGGVVALRDGNRRIVGAYAGDANGNLWRFNLTGTNWTATKMYTTSPARPIYAAPSFQMARGGARKKADGTGNAETCSTGFLDGKCGTVVVFGTGILLTDAHRTSSDTQSIYGIWDPTPIEVPAEDTKTTVWLPSKTGILMQTIDAASATTTTTTGTNAVSNISKLYKVSSNTIDYVSTHMGWKLNLGTITGTDGERILTDVANIGRSVVLTSTIVTTAADSLESCSRTNTNPNVTYVLRAIDGANVAGFKNKTGQLKNFSVGLSLTGGFDNAILAGRSGSDAAGTSDVFNPYAVGKPGESIVTPDQVMSECTKTSAKQVAKSDTSVVDGCISSDWQRTWRQLSAPPQ